MKCNFYRPLFNITADAGVEVEAYSPQDLICKSLMAAVCEMVELDKVHPLEEKILKVDSAGFPYLVADVINTFLVVFESDKFIPVYCEVLRLKPDGTYTEIKLKGERKNNFRGKLLIKAATYHDL